ncbi:MAG: hypothetical protein ACRDKA_14105 [Actinomycetota bacterium]
MAALALPVALALGALAELAAGIVRRVVRGERGWWRGVTGRWTDLRRLLRSGRARPAVVEAAGAAGALAGAGLAAGAALGLLPGSIALAYPALALGVIGGHLASPIRRGIEGPAARARLHAALAEPAFAVALGAMVLRWRSLDLEAIRGTQTVLGPGIALAPALAAAGLALAALAAVWAGAMRLPSDEPVPRRGGQARGAGASLLSALARWAVAGATSLVVAVLVAGHRIDPSPAAVPFAAAAAIAAVLLGGSVAGARLLAPRRRPLLTAAALVVAAVAVVLVVAA